MSQYFLNTAPQDILGMSEDSPDWWAGRSFAFVEPISTFASFAAEQAVNQASGAIRPAESARRTGIDRHLDPSELLERDFCRRLGRSRQELPLRGRHLSLAHVPDA